MGHSSSPPASRGTSNGRPPSPAKRAQAYAQPSHRPPPQRWRTQCAVQHFLPSSHRPKPLPAPPKPPMPSASDQRWPHAGSAHSPRIEGSKPPAAQMTGHPDPVGSLRYFCHLAAKNLAHPGPGVPSPPLGRRTSNKRAKRHTTTRWQRPQRRGGAPQGIVVL